MKNQKVQVVEGIEAEFKNWENYGKKRIYVTLSGSPIHHKENQLAWDCAAKKFVQVRGDFELYKGLGNDRKAQIVEAVRAVILEEGK